MASDRARISFDPTRDYRTVVAQQGRVTLEADVNEAAWMASEALRLETIDMVGPAGTPDNGYEVKVDGNEAIVDIGIMYAGGWRFKLDKKVALDNQPDWADQPVADQPQANTPTNLLVALLAIEQSVTAVEDQALREVALGGPDTAARMRLMQHFVQVETGDTTCAAAAGDLTKQLAAEGLILHPGSLELTFYAGLQVSFPTQTQTVDPCCPPAQGGYLGADNQLVRVTVTSYDSSTGQGTLLWGWNNASFLYRARLVDKSASPQILTLSPAPIDVEHTPQQGQVIEVLRTTCVLGDPADANYVAALQGEVMTLGAGSIFSSNQLTLPGTLPAAYTSDTNPLFVRLWQGMVTFTEGVAQPLDAVSGIAVTIKMKALPAAPFDARPFWHFAVRPNTPLKVYPQRYGEQLQDPDGPRQWLCDLALVESTPGPAPSSPPVLKRLADCRVKFLPLTKLGACDCCALTLDPNEDWQGKLNAAIANKDTEAINVCFQPGTFKATSTVKFTGISVKMTGAGFSTVIEGDSLEVVLEFDKCPWVSLSDIAVLAGTAGFTASNGTQNLQGTVTLRDCTAINIERAGLECMGADFRSASCLYVINTVSTANKSRGQKSLYILNNRLAIGNSQVGILLVNADRAQVEGNWLVTEMNASNVTRNNIAQHPQLQAQLEKSLVKGVTMVDTAAAQKKVQRKLLKQQMKAALKGAAKKTEEPAAQDAVEHRTQEDEAAKPEAAKPEATKPEAEVKSGSASVASSKAIAANTIQKINLGAIGRAHITAGFGTVILQFESDHTLTNAWSTALAASSLNANSTMRQIRDTVTGIAKAAILGKTNTQKAFADYIDEVLPRVFSTSSQGIVVGGSFANDIRITNNTIDGAAQGIHVGLSDRKADPAVSHLQANLVQIAGNSINLRLTPLNNQDRHGIYVGSVISAVIRDNNVTLTRTGESTNAIAAIKVFGRFGPRVLIEGNYMNGFVNQTDTGIFAQPAATDSPAFSVWKAADNCSSASSNGMPGFITINNNMP